MPVGYASIAVTPLAAALPRNRLAWVCHGIVGDIANAIKHVDIGSEVTTSQNQGYMPAQGRWPGVWMLAAGVIRALGESVLCAEGVSIACQGDMSPGWANSVSRPPATDRGRRTCPDRQYP